MKNIVYQFFISSFPKTNASGQGITYHPDAAQLAILQGFEEVVNAAATRPDGEGCFDQLRQAGVLSGVLRTYYAQFISPQAAIGQLQRSLDEQWLDRASD